MGTSAKLILWKYSFQSLALSANPSLVPGPSGHSSSPELQYNIHHCLALVDCNVLSQDGHGGFISDFRIVSQDGRGGFISHFRIVLLNWHVGLISDFRTV